MLVPDFDLGEDRLNWIEVRTVLHVKDWVKVKSIILMDDILANVDTKLVHEEEDASFAKLPAQLL